MDLHTPNSMMSGNGGQRRRPPAIE